MSTDYMQSPDDAPSVAENGPAVRGSSNVLPEYVIDAFEMPSLERFIPDLPGDYAAGALVRYGYRTIPKLDGNGNREVPVIILHGVTVLDEGSNRGELGYVEIMGLASVLERQLRYLEQCEVGTLIRVQYMGHKQSPTKGHSDYADFDVTIGRRTDQVPIDVITNAPEVLALDTIANVGELNSGEAF